MLRISMLLALTSLAQAQIKNENDRKHLIRLRSLIAHNKLDITVWEVVDIPVDL